MTGKRQQPPADEGASLIYALTVVAIIGIIMAPVLYFAESSVRTTTAMNRATQTRAAEEGAAQIAVNAVRLNTYTGNAGACFGATGTLTLSNFYQPSEGPATSAAITCEPDPTRIIEDSLAYSDANRPPNAILTLGTAPDGINIDPAGRDLQIRGPVYSNSTITVPATAGSSLTVQGNVTAEGTCAGPINADPTLECESASLPVGDDPDYPAPVPPDPLPVRDAEVPTCADNAIITLNPGLYTDVTALRRLSLCNNVVVHFTPGTYYFDFTENVPWYLSRNITLIAGELTNPLVAGVPPTLPGACRSPFPPDPVGSWTPPDPGQGVQFVFGAGSRMEVRTARVEICGSYSATSPPIALYGLKADTGIVRGQAGSCVVPPGTCPVLRVPEIDEVTMLEANGQLYVQGTAYLPQNSVDIRLSNTGGPLFAGGLIARNLNLVADDSATLTGPVFTLPDYAPPGRLTVLYLNVYLCPGQSTCSVATGTRRLSAKIGVIDPTGLPVAGSREIAIYSWSSQDAINP